MCIRDRTKTVADAWSVLPYENQIVTLELARDDFLALAARDGLSTRLRLSMTTA